MPIVSGDTSFSEKELSGRYHACPVRPHTEARRGGPLAGAPSFWHRFVLAR
jgi:hypothetical protein